MERHFKERGLEYRKTATMKNKDLKASSASTKRENRQRSEGRKNKNFGGPSMEKQTSMPVLVDQNAASLGSSCESSLFTRQLTGGLHGQTTAKGRNSNVILNLVTADHAKTKGSNLFKLERNVKE